MVSGGPSLAVVSGGPSLAVVSRPLPGCGERGGPSLAVVSRPLPGCGEWGLLSSCVCGLLPAVASLLAELRLWAQAQYLQPPGSRAQAQ